MSEGKFLWSRPWSGQKCVLDKTVVMPRKGDVLFFESELNGQPILIPNLRGYCIVPKEDYARLTGDMSVLESPREQYEREQKEAREGIIK